MKLHPVTLLLLLALGVQLAVAIIQLAGTLSVDPEIIGGAPGIYLNFLIPRLQDVVASLLLAGTAASVETLSRCAAHLRAVRLGDAHHSGRTA